MILPVLSLLLGKPAPGDFHGEKVVEHLATRMVGVVALRAADVEVELHCRGVYGSGSGGRVAGARCGDQRFTIAHPLRHHEVDLVVLVQQLVVEPSAPEAPAGDEKQALGPVGVAASGVAVLEQEGGNAPILARGELHEAIELYPVDALG